MSSGRVRHCPVTYGCLWTICGRVHGGLRPVPAAAAQGRSGFWTSSARSANIGDVSPLTVQARSPRADRFGVPEHLVGTHPDDFFGCVGRIVVLSALLEDRLLVLVHQQTGGLRPLWKINKLGPAGLIAEGRGHLSSFMDDDSRALADEFFTRAAGAMMNRHDVVHNLWPAQDDGPPFGWRTARRESQDDPCMTKTTYEFRALILTLVDLVAVAQSLSMRVSIGSAAALGRPGN